MLATSGASVNAVFMPNKQASFLLAFLSTTFIPTPFALYGYGETMRKKSKASQQDFSSIKRVEEKESFDPSLVAAFVESGN